MFSTRPGAYEDCHLSLYDTGQRFEHEASSQVQSPDSTLQGSFL